MEWSKLPSFKAGPLNAGKRSERYSNPPSNPGLKGLLKNPGRRDGVTGTSKEMSRKGKPFK